MVDIGECDLGRIEGFFDDRHDVFDVLTRGDFRYDTAEFPVDWYLRRYDIGANVTAVFNDGSRRFVTTGFEC